MQPMLSSPRRRSPAGRACSRTLPFPRPRLTVWPSRLGRPPAATKEAPMDGKVLQDAVIAPNDNWSAVLTPRQTLRIVDLEGKQAVDFLCYNANDVADRYNAADTMKYNKNVYLGGGHGIYSVRATKLFHDRGGHDGRRPRYHRRLLQRRQQHVPLQGAVR